MVGRSFKAIADNYKDNTQDRSLFIVRLSQIFGLLFIIVTLSRHIFLWGQDDLDKFRLQWWRLQFLYHSIPHGDKATWFAYKVTFQVTPIVALVSACLGMVYTVFAMFLFKLTLYPIEIFLCMCHIASSTMMGASGFAAGAHLSGLCSMTDLKEVRNPNCILLIHDKGAV